MARDAELLLRLDLGRQPVAVPSEAALDAVTAHRPIARHGVLHVPGQQVAVVRQSVGKGRTVVEHELVVAVLPRRPLLDRTPERVLTLPALEHGALEGGQVGLGLDARVTVAGSAAHGSLLHG